MTTTHRNALLLAPLVLTMLCAGPVHAASQFLMIPAAAFSADGTDPENYINYGDYLETRNSTTLHFHAWVRLPHLATITNVDMMTRDDDAGTITGYLKRTQFGVDGGTETLLTFTSPGNIGCTTDGLCHDMESLLDIEVNAAEYSYWFDVVVPDSTAVPENDLEFYAVRIMYDDVSPIFTDGFESGGTSKWSSAVGAKSTAASPSGQVEVLERSKLLANFASQLYIEDPLAQEALEKALLGKAGYASPYVIPGPAFKTEGYTEYDDYYFSESYGFVYGRPAGDGDAVLSAPVYLPDGAELSYFFAFYVDSVRTGTQADIRFWLSRMDTVDIVPTDNLVYVTTSGRDTDIEAVSVNSSTMEAAVPGGTTIDNSHYSYWVTIDVGPYDLSPPDPYQDEEWWHKVYSIVILYTMP